MGLHGVAVAQSALGGKRNEEHLRVCRSLTPSAKDKGPDWKKAPEPELDRPLLVRGSATKGAVQATRLGKILLWHSLRSASHCCAPSLSIGIYKC